MMKNCINCANNRLNAVGPRNPCRYCENYSQWKPTKSDLEMEGLVKDGDGDVYGGSEQVPWNFCPNCGADMRGDG